MWKKRAQQRHHQADRSIQEDGEKKKKSKPENCRVRKAKNGFST